jgi:hypothetical protein
MTTEAPARPTRRQVAALLVEKAIEELQTAARDDLVTRLERERDHLVNPELHVLVIGEFKKGKSALINALLGMRICPVDADVATAHPTLIRHGEHLAAWAVQRIDDDSDAVQRDPIAIPDLKLLEDSEDERLRSIEITAPREILRRGVVLVDTPGVGGGLASTHALATTHALTLADAVIFVTDASQEYTAAEIAFLERARDVCPTVICALTKIDFYPSWRRILDIDRAHLERAGIAADILPLSARMRHHALELGDDDLDEESGYPELIELLSDRIVGERETLVTRNAAASVRACLRQLSQQLLTEHTALTSPERLLVLREQLSEAQTRTERLCNQASRWQTALNDSIQEMSANLDEDLSNRLRSIRQEALETIESSDPSEIWPEFESWLYQRTNDELSQHHGAIVNETNRVAQRVAQLFADEAEEAAVDIELDIAAMNADVTPVPSLKFERLTKSQVGFMAVRGSVAAQSMVGMAGTVAGNALGLSLLASPLAAVAPLIIIGGLIARKTAKDARNQHLRQVRAEAQRATLGYIQDGKESATRASRSLLRMTQRGLKEHFENRAQEFNRSLTEARQATKVAEQSDQATTARRIREIEQQQQRVARLVGVSQKLAPETANDEADRV